MDYELCKKLKDAGFPINGSGDFLEGSIETDEGGIVTTNNVYVPTLSELIEACGEGFDSLSRIKDYKSFRTIGWVSNLCSINSLNVYSTPEESVAYLWLELNK